MRRDTRRGVRTWLNLFAVAVTLAYVGWLIHLLRTDAKALLWIATLLLSIPIIFVVSHAIENGLQRLSAKWGDREVTAEGLPDTDGD